jgi:hypothetical protein
MHYFFCFLKVILRIVFLIHLLFKLNIYVLSSRFKELKHLKNDISSFLKKYFKDWNILFDCVWRWKWKIFIYLKRFLNFYFTHSRQWVIKFIFLHVCVCWCCAFCNGFSKTNALQEIYMFTYCSIFSFLCISYICAFFIHKSPWSCSLAQFWNSMMKKFKNIPPKNDIISLQKKQDVLWS